MHLLALLMVMGAGILWASGGIAAQHLFTHSAVSPGSLTTFRMFWTGMIILALTCARGYLRRDWQRLCRNRRLLRDLLIYAVLALWAMHYTYYKSIEEGNAAAATVIQYTCPAMVILYESVRYWKRPGKCELLTVLMAVGGTFLLVTGGSLEKLSVPAACIVWGLLSAVFFAAVSIYPKHLLIQFSNEFLLTAGMFLGAGFSWILFPPISLSDFLTQPVLFDVSWIILFGTALAFICFNTGLARLKPAEASVTATVEPLAAVVFSYLLFDMTFGAVEMVGVIMIIGAISVLAVKDFIHKGDD